MEKLNIEPESKDSYSFRSDEELKPMKNEQT